MGDLPLRVASNKAQQVNFVNNRTRRSRERRLKAGQFLNEREKTEQ